MPVACAAAIAWMLVACNAPPARESAPRETTTPIEETAAPQSPQSLPSGGVEGSPDPGPVKTAATGSEKASDPRPAGDRTAVDPRPRVVRVGHVTLESLKRLRGGDAVPQADVERAFVGVPSIVKKCYQPLLSLDDDKGPAGRIVATFDIMPSGAVANIEVTGAFSDERPGKCLRAALLIQRFAPRESATVASYRAVLELEPGEVQELPDIRLR